MLDWELAHVGDPLEDLGWLCVKSWRFGSPLPVGGFGRLEELVSAYERASGRHVDPDALYWWQVLETMRWGIICIVQVMTHLSGVVRSVELAAIGRRVAEVEWDLLRDAAMTSMPPHDVPSAPELLDAVREFLESEVIPHTEGRRRFEARVAANVVAMVQREMILGPAQSAAHAERLRSPWCRRRRSIGTGYTFRQAR